MIANAARLFHKWRESAGPYAEFLDQITSERFSAAGQVALDNDAEATAMCGLQNVGGARDKQDVTPYGCWT